MKAISFFAGVGGFDLGLRAAGHEIVGACELDDYARRVYAARFGEPAWFPTDILAVQPEGIPEADLWCGGPPCQSFSIAGARGGMEDARGNLFLHFIALAAVCQPHTLLIENVGGLLSSSEGRDFGAILAALVAQGRRVAWTTLDARYFGVAQRRRRVFFVATLDGDPREVQAPQRANGTTAVGSNPVGGCGAGLLIHDGLRVDAQAVDVGSVGNRAGGFGTAGSCQVAQERSVAAIQLESAQVAHHGVTGDAAYSHWNNFNTHLWLRSRRLRLAADL